MQFSKQKLKEIKTIAASKLLQQNKQIIINTFEYTKESLLLEFLNHPVTKELQAGADSSSSGSDVLSDISPVGNLFSFIGFDRGYDPIAPILERLKLIQLDFKQNGEFITIEIKNYPLPQEIFNPALTPMPRQQGRSWAKGIESGISGLNYFLFVRDKTFKKSASGHAIQLKDKVRGGKGIFFKGAKFNNAKYITNLLNKYKNVFAKLYRFEYGITVIID